MRYYESIDEDCTRWSLTRWDEDDQLVEYPENLFERNKLHLLDFLTNFEKFGNALLEADVQSVTVVKVLARMHEGLEERPVEWEDYYESEFDDGIERIISALDEIISTDKLIQVLMEAGYRGWPDDNQTFYWLNPALQEAMSQKDVRFVGDKQDLITIWKPNRQQTSVSFDDLVSNVESPTEVRPVLVACDDDLVLPRDLTDYLMEHEPTIVKPIKRGELSLFLGKD